MNMARLNMSQIDELKDLMEEAFADLVETYISDSEEKITRLRDAIEASDAPLSAEISHSLKGSSANICAEDLSELFKAIEDQARQDTLSQIPQPFSDVQDEYQRVKGALQNLL